MTSFHSRQDALSMDKLLEDEKQRNKADTWSKLRKDDKLLKLDIFANIWCEENSNIMVNDLILFLHICLDKNKLKNKKDIIYDRITMEIKKIPSLHYTDGVFSLITDVKRISTLKSLTPKRIALNCN